VLTAGGTDVTMVFPRFLLVQEVNLYLRGTPSRIAATPYTHGWMFEARMPEGEEAVGPELRRGDEALEWMRSEVDRLSRFVHAEAGAGLDGVLADGGTFGENLPSQLGREAVLRMAHDFFSPFTNWNGK